MNIFFREGLPSAARERVVSTFKETQPPGQAQNPFEVVSP